MGLFSDLKAVGICPLPVADGSDKFKDKDGNSRAKKQPVMAWKGLQEAMPGDLAVTAWDKQYRHALVGAVCGKVSGGLEVLDFDIPGKQKGEKPPLWSKWVQLLKDHGHEDLLRKLVVYTTESGGKQAMYRCPEADDGNRKLAQRKWLNPVTDKEETACLIETRGQGGYVVCPPTQGYKFQSGSFDNIPVLNLEDRNTLIEAAILLDEMPSLDDQEPSSPSPPSVGGIRPGDDYSAKTSWDSLLSGLGWTKGSKWGEKQFWVRPGKNPRYGHSAVQDDRLYVFSTSAGLPSERQLTQFAVYAHSQHQGDFTKAAKQLAKEGYGERGSVAVADSLIDSISSISTYNHTDAGNAKRFIDSFGDRVRFCHQWGKWLVWVGTHWSMDEKGGANIHELCLQMANDIAEEAAATEDKATKDNLLGWSLKCESRAKMDNCLALVKSNLAVAVEPGELDSNPWLLNCLNGTLNLKTGELLPHSQSDLITRVISVPYLEDAPFDLWMTFLERIIPDSEVRTFLLKALGYSLTGHTGEQCFFFLHGSQGANGKSTFMEVVQHILGGYSRAMQPDTLMQSHVARTGASPDIARLKGSRFVSAPETTAGRRLDEQLVKQLTGGDRMVARYLYQDEFEFIPELKLWITGNHKPTITGSDNAIWRRVRLIPFSVVIPEEERDGGLKEKLLTQSPGILRLMVMGCLDWQDEKLKAPETVLASVADYRAEMDVLGDFLADKCVIGAELSVGSSSLYETYRLWATAEGLRPWTQKAFSMALQERGIEKVKTMYGAEFRGLGAVGA